ncbi:PQQ-binding-like beta-propeller repeat protein [Streptomyces sp. ISL-36]|uniref:protein kinase domain-containing protein n=1 Tax=Streptomyces sp. ISL-36 TaxID=2819182 RepID=UPI001BE5DAF2|nr:PQQ-binding-like beta-propeller repeat protein [Streptomyces sp. ISL-36]MBT2441952.1 PQQ-binding-like beta-propeller repeat protein [Streptomyces sp. ISL-36]
MEPLGAADPRRIGPYALVGRLGAGGMGAVYLSRSSGGRTVAVKVVRADLAEDTAFRDRFRREVAAARLVSGAFTAPVVDADPDAEVPWMATAFVVGVSLHRAVATHGPLPEAALRMLTAGLAEALVGVHGAAVIHRDLKPANVLLALDGPHVIDFGIARATDGTALTSTGAVIGSAPYMSPEQALGQHLTPASDVFSLGTTVAFAACGESPFGDGAGAAVLFRVVHTEPDLSAVPAGLRPLIERCLAKDAALRPTPREVIAAIERPGPRPDPRVDPRAALPPVDAPRPSAGWLPDPIAADVLALRAALTALPAPEPTLPLTGPTEVLPGGSGTAPTAPDRRKLLLGLTGGALAVAGTGTVWALTRDTSKGNGKNPLGGSGGTSGGTPRPSAESVPDAKLAWQARLPASVAQVLPGSGIVACVMLAEVVGLDRRGEKKWTVKGADHGDMPFAVTGPTARTVAAVAGDRLYVSGARFTASGGGQTGGRARVLGIRMADGKDPWTIELADRPAMGVLDFPGVRDGRAYVFPMTTDESAAYEIGVWALDLAARRTAWFHRTEAMPVFWGLPQTGGGLLYADTKRIVAVDAKGGAAWSKEFQAVLVGAAGRYFLVADAAGTLFALEPATGRQAWKAAGVVETSLRGDGVATDEKGTLAFVLLRDEDGGFSLAALDTASGRTRWRSPLPADAEGSSRLGARLLYADGNVYRMGADGMLWAFDASNGNPRWKYGGFKGNSPTELAWGAGDRRLCVSDTGATTVAALDANGA